MNKWNNYQVTLANCREKKNPQDKTHEKEKDETKEKKK